MYHTSKSGSQSKPLKRFVATLLMSVMVLSGVVAASPGIVKADSNASLTIEASKTLDGNAPDNEKFEFQILQNGTEVKSASNDANGKIVFDALTFSAAGTYTYTVKEKIPAGADANNVKDGIKYDNTEHTVVVVVNDSCVITSVTVDGTAVQPVTSGGTDFNLESDINVVLYGTNGDGEYITVDGGYNFTDPLFNLRAGDVIVYCFDDGILTATNEPLSYTEFDTDNAPEFSGSTGEETEKIIKKLLYYGAPNDAGNLVQWLKNYNDPYYGMTYDQKAAEDYLEFMTGALLHNITNPLQGIGFNPDYPGIETYQILDQVIDKATGEFIYDAVDRNTVYDLMAQKLWKLVIDPATDSVADLVTLHIYAPNGQGPERPDDSGPDLVYQRVITAEIAPSSSAAVNLTFANTTAETQTEVGKLSISKTVTGDNAPADQSFTFTVTGLPAGSFTYKIGETTKTISNNGMITLKGGETATIEGIPAGTNYTVTEGTLPANWSNTSKSGDTGTIVKDQTASASFTNKYEEQTESENPYVQIRKTDAATSEELAGATLTLKKSDGTLIETWESDGNAKVIQLEPGTYTLTEDAAPLGYNMAESITFRVDENGVVGAPVEMKDAPYVEVSFTKKALGGDELEGAKIQILDSKGTKVAEWTSTKEAHKVKLADGDYVMHEEAAPEGYYVATDIPFTVKSGDPSATTKVNMEDKRWGEVIISKTDATTSKELAGATIQIFDSKGTKVAEWKTTTEAHKIHLKEGTYTLTEISAPDGYNVAETITFEVNKDGLVEGEKVEMKDQPYTEVSFTKTDLGGNELPGAKIQLLDKNGKVLDEWISTKDAHKIKLPDGEYTMHEEAAPSGYKVATDIPFVVKAGSAKNTTAVNMEDEAIPETIDITVTKVWDDDDDAYGKRPESITVSLRGNGGNTGKSAKLNEKNNWTCTFRDLPKQEDGMDISYNVMEEGVPEGYVSDPSGDAAEGFVITNTYIPEETEETSETKGGDDRGYSELSSKVTVAGIKATDKKAAHLTYDKIETTKSFTETLVYKNLVPGARYNVEAYLLRLTLDDEYMGDDEGLISMVEEEYVADDSGNGSWEIKFKESDTIFQPYSKYVVVDYVWSKEDSLYPSREKALEHYDLGDSAQSIITPDEVGDFPEEPDSRKIASVVSVDGKKGSVKEAASISYSKAKDLKTVTDTVYALGLYGDSSYKITGQVWRVENGKAVEKIGESTSSKKLKTDIYGYGEVSHEISLDKALKKGEKYVVFEYAVNENDKTDHYEHEDPSDKSQTFVVDESNASAASTSATKTAAAATSTKTAATNAVKSVNTGDGTQPLLYAVILIAAVAVMAFIVRKRRRDDV